MVRPIDGEVFIVNPLFEVLSQGEEVVTGQVADTNAAWLSQEAVGLGFTVARHTSVGDKLEDLICLLNEIAVRADCCVCTGGLGPTSDDLTAEAVSLAFNLPLAFDSVAFDQIKAYFDKRGRMMPASNRKQALLPATSIRLDNRWGTAPGFAVKHERCRFWFVPGVPSEMKEMFAAHVKPMLTGCFDLHPGRLITIGCVGVGESELQDRIGAITLPPDVQLGFRAQIGIVQTKLLFPSGFPVSLMKEVTELTAKTIGDSVYSIDGLDDRQDASDLAAVAGRLALASGKKIAVVETASFGLLTAKIGMADWLAGGEIYPSIAAMAQAHGMDGRNAGWREIATAATLSIRKKTGADTVLLQIVPEQEQNEKAVNLVNMLVEEGGIKERSRNISGLAERKQQMAALLSLDFLRRCLLEIPG